MTQRDRLARSDEPTSTDQLDQTADHEGALDAPDASHEPTSTPLTHHEPAAAHAEAGDEHADEHMSDAHGHADVRLGPIDWAGWGYAAVGLLAGLLVVVAFWLAITPKA